MAEFTVDKLHLAMLKRVNIDTDGLDTPAVDAKRPYGNKDVLSDLIALYNADTGYEVVRIEDGGGFLLLDGDKVVARGGQGGEDDLEDYLLDHHRSLGVLFEILSQNLSIEEGTYKNVDHQGWKFKGKEAAARRVVVAVASSLTSTDQADVEAALERVLQHTDVIQMLPHNRNYRIKEFLERTGMAAVEEKFNSEEIDLVLAVFDPLMERKNAANTAPRQLLELAQEYDVPSVEESSRPRPLN